MWFLNVGNGFMILTWDQSSDKVQVAGLMRRNSQGSELHFKATELLQIAEELADFLQKEKVCLQDIAVKLHSRQVSDTVIKETLKSVRASPFKASKLRYLHSKWAKLQKRNELTVAVPNFIEALAFGRDSLYFTLGYRESVNTAPAYFTTLEEIGYVPAESLVSFADKPLLRLLEKQRKHENEDASIKKTERSVVDGFTVQQAALHVVGVMRSKTTDANAFTKAYLLMLALIAVQPQIVRRGRHMCKKIKTR